jgi:transcription elongation factor GreA
MTTYMTRKKHDELIKTLGQMERDYRKFAETELAEAVDLGDIRENAEYDSAVWHQNHKAASIAELRYALNTHISFIEDLRIDSSRVSIGTKVTLKATKTDKIEEYSILGPYDADLSKGIVSFNTPFAKLLMLKKVGDLVTVDSGIIYEIITIAPLFPKTNEKAADST